MICINLSTADKPRPLGSVSIPLSPRTINDSHANFFLHALENILNQDLHVQAAVMFGRGRFYPGVVVDPKPEFRFDPVDEVALSDFRNLIW